MRNLKTIIIIIILSLPLAVLSAPQCISLFQLKNKNTESQIETDNAAKIQYFEKLLNTVNALRITKDQSLLSESYVQLLRKNLRKELKTKDLTDPEALDYLQEKMVKNLTRLRANQEKQKPFIKKEEETELDLFNGYGFRLLPETDITFNTPEFKAELLKYTLKQQGAGFSEKQPFHTVLTLGKNFISELQKAVDYDLKRVKSKSKFSVRMHSFFQTGSDANNHLYQIANKTEVKRKSSTDSNFNPPEKEILFLSGIYGAGRGKMSKSGIYGHDKRMDKWIVESPTVNDLKHISSEELIEVKKIEEQSLKDIREKIDNVEMNVGGIFIEPVLGSKGVLFYRTEFLLNVQKLAEEYNIPIFVDEILAGGGRTGRIFSFMHYEGFVPDYITYGKGMQIAGILKVRKGYSFAHPSIESDGTFPTMAFQPEAMVRSIAFLKAVNTRKLTAHAEAVGEYFKQELKKRAKKPEEVRGAGLMLFAKEDMISDFNNTRILPNLTIEKKDIDHLLKNIENINP